MPKVRYSRYSGTRHIREIDASAWRQVGVEDQNKVVWDPSNDHTADVSNAAAKHLLDKEDGFELVDAKASAEEEEDEDDSPAKATGTTKKAAKRT